MVYRGLCFNVEHLLYLHKKQPSKVRIFFQKSDGTVKKNVC